MTRRAWLIVSLAALAACVTNPRTAAPPPAAGLELLEPILGAKLTADGVTIRVRSSGCTTKQDFAFYIERAAPTPTLVFGRKRIDTCKGPAGAVDLSFSFAELGLGHGAQVFILNPFAGESGRPP